jgi:predicted  nucleic acid-binding Zn-ribbon protein
MNSGTSASSGVNQSEEMAALALRNSELLSELDRVRNELSLLKAEREDEKAELQVLNQDLDAALNAAKAEEGA